MTDIHWTLQTFPLDKLTDYYKNPRQLSEKQFKQLKKSLDKFGVIDKPIINADAAHTVIGGHQRLHVLRADNVKEVECWIPDRVLTDKEVEELNVRLNKNTGDWSFDVLANEFEFEDLKEWGFDEKELLGNGFSQDDPADAEPQIDRAAELNEKWQVKTGDLFKIGEHRLLCGDSTVKADVDRVMGGEKASLVVTSPPYNQQLDTFKPSGMQKESPAFVNRMASSYSDSRPEEDYQTEQVELLEMLKEFINPNGSIFYNHKIRYREKAIVSPLDWLRLLSFPVRQEIIWNRGSSITMNARMFIPADERIYWLRVGDDFTFNDETEIKSWSTVWNVGAKNDVQISAAFATEIPTRCIKAGSQIGDVVIEPYAGSGTTMVACENLHRKCRAIEISPNYCAVILERMITAFPELEIIKIQ